jgi:hypothetical protein
MAKGKHDRQEYAIKFFASHQGFEAEHALYWSGQRAQASVLAQFLPKVHFPSHVFDIIAIISCPPLKSA